MILTEEEAKTKWCPHYQVTTEEVKCIGSECMAWRWTDQTGRTYDGREVREVTGYCGLAGEPK